MFDRLACAMAHRKVAWATVIVVLALAALSLGSARKLQREDDLLAFLPRGNPAVKAFYDINKRFGGLDVALVGIESDDVFAPAFLQRLRQITRELRETPGLNNVLSLANVLDFAPDREHGGIIAGPLVGQLPGTAEERAALRARVMSRDLVVGNLVSSNGRAVLIYCFLALGTDAKGASAEIARVVTASFPTERKYWGGNPFISSYIYNTTQADLWRLTPWAGLVIVLIMMLAFRDVIATGLALLSTGIGIVMSLGLMSALGIRFNIVLGSMPVIMLALGSAYAIHILARYYTLAADADTETAVRLTVKSVGPAVIAAGLTTVASLLSFVFMDIGPLRIFGLFTAIGLTIKLVLSVTFIPAVVLLLGRKRRPGTSAPLRRATARLAVAACTHRLAVGLALGALAIGGLVFATRVDWRLDQGAFFSPGSPPDEAERYLREHFGGSQFIQLHVRGDMNDPGVLREVQRMADEIVFVPHVSSVLHVGKTVAQVQNALTGQLRIPDTAAQVKEAYSFLAGEPSVRGLVLDDHSEALLMIKVDSNRAADLAVPLATLEQYAQAQTIRSYVAATATGPRRGEVESRRQELVLARFRAAAHAAGSSVPEARLARLRADLQAPATVRDPRAVEDGLREFLRSDESLVELPPATGADDPARRVAAALAALGPGAEPAAITSAIATTLGKTLDDSEIADLSQAVGTPLRELWVKATAMARAAQLLRDAGLTPPAGQRGESLVAAATGAAMDLEAPGLLLPAGSQTPTGTLGLQITGLPVMDRGLSRSVVANQAKSLVFALLLVFVIMMVLFRSFGSGLLGMMPAAFTLIVIYGGMGLVGEGGLGLVGVGLDIGTSMLGSIIIGAGVDYAIHLLTAWRAPPDGTLAEAAAVGADRSGLAVWTNAVMVAAGFFVLTLGQARPLKNVGGMTAAAMITAAVATFLAIPVLARRKAYRRSTDPETVADDAPTSEVAETPAAAGER